VKKILLLLALCLAATLALGQRVSLVDSYQEVNQQTDSTWLVQVFGIYEGTLLLGEGENAVEYPLLDTVLIAEETQLLDSAQVIRFLAVSTTNEQARESAFVRRAFTFFTSRRNILSANTKINEISNGQSNYFEEASKIWADELSGLYRVLIDSAGVQLDFFAELSLVSNALHPDGRILRLERCEDASCEVKTGDFWNVQPYHKNTLFLANFFDKAFPFFWDGTSQDRPVYRPLEFVTREDVYSRLIKIR